MSNYAVASYRFFRNDSFPVHLFVFDRLGMKQQLDP